MKKIFLCMLVSCMMISCHEDGTDASSSTKDSGITALTSLNPNEPIILDVSNEKGESIVLMGDKDESGSPTMLQQMIIQTTEDENATEIYFDENEMIEEMIAPNGVRFLFDWVSNTKIALTLIDPNTNEQMNTLVDLENPQGETVSTKAKSISTIAKRRGKAVFSVEPIKNSPKKSPNPTRTTSIGKIGNVYLEQCGFPATAQCWVDVYDYSTLTGSFGRGKYRGRFSCTEVGDGHYQFRLPDNYNVHHDIADYCDAINDIVQKICGANAWTAPGTGAKQYLCVAISGAIASGIVSAPVAAGFLVACETTSYALDAGCGLLNGNLDLPEGSPNLGDGICAWLHEIDYTWDTPLLIEPVVNALPSNIYGSSQILEADGAIKDMKVMWGGNPTINTFELNPSAPSEGVSYSAIATLHCLPVGTNITMDIVGTDGYTNSETYTIESGALNYTATLYVPGAASGVKDVCTVTIVTPSGETVTKKASLIFQ